MNVYVDSSVVLRVALGEPSPLKAWSRISTAVSSEIVRVECLRVLDRLRLGGSMDDRELARRRTTILEVLASFDLIRINRAVLDRAGEPFPTLVRTLDALHVASALLARSRYPSLAFATHDEQLATAVLAEGFRVIGAS